MGQVTAELAWNEEVAPGYHLMALVAPEIATAAAPGQFVHVRIGPSYDPLLRRPLSVLRADPQAGKVWMLVKVVGRGTELLAEMAPGTPLDVMGPLGKGFPEPPPSGDLVLVAGGVGVAPLIFWAERLQSSYPEVNVISVYGAATEDALACWVDLAGRSDEFYVATDDGSAGEQGLVTDLLPGYLSSRRLGAVYACGPRPMLAAVVGPCREAGVPCHIAMEQWMGCGVGACLACAVPAAGGGYVRVCTEGPVFPADAIDWGRLT